MEKNGLVTPTFSDPHSSYTGLMNSTQCMFAPKNEVGKNRYIYMRLGWAIESEQYWIICFVERDWASG